MRDKGLQERAGFLDRRRVGLLSAHAKDALLADIHELAAIWLAVVDSIGSEVFQPTPTDILAYSLRRNDELGVGPSGESSSINRTGAHPRRCQAYV